MFGYKAVFVILLSLTTVLLCDARYILIKIDAPQIVTDTKSGICIDWPCLNNLVLKRTDAYVRGLRYLPVYYLS